MEIHADTLLTAYFLMMWYLIAILIAFILILIRKDCKAIIKNTKDWVGNDLDVSAFKTFIIILAAPLTIPGSLIRLLRRRNWRW